MKPWKVPVEGENAMRTPLPVENKGAPGAAARELVKSEAKLPSLKANRALFESNGAAEELAGA
jgi:hypothetical protein